MTMTRVPAKEYDDGDEDLADTLSDQNEKNELEDRSVLLNETSYRILERSSSKLRWPILFLTAVSLIGWIVSYDSIGALTVSLQEERNLTASQIGILYYLYGLPNLVWLSFAGLTVDKIGTSLSLVIFSAVTALGTMIVPFNNFNAM